MRLHLGIDVACRASHRATCTDATGEIQFSGRRFTTTPEDLERLWDGLPGTDDVVVIVEPTRNAWAPLAAWFRHRGAKVVLVPPEQSAELRDYYSKHTKNDRLDSRVLARLPLLHPEGLRGLSDTGPANALRRAVRRRSTLVERRTATFYRLDALLELLGPAWADARTGAYSKAALAVLEKTGADSHAIRRLGRKRLAAMLIRHSRGQWREEHAERIVNAAQQTLNLWPDGALDFAELAEDIAGEAHMAAHLNAQITTLEDRIAVLYEEADPGQVIASGPGFGVTTAAGILGRLGDPNRFASLAGIRAFTGLVPRVSQSGLAGRNGPPTRQGDPGLRETLFKAADIARHVDPTLAARYHDLVANKGKHHNSALCTLAAALITRLAACWRNGTLYELRDTDGRDITEAEGRQICATRYKVDKAARAKVHVRRRSQQLKNPMTSRREKESRSAPATGSSTTTLRTSPQEHHELLDVR
ncbi:IS110 family transposase [Streptomyces sp. NPDC059909]|uniref:IS110 family transposase n=1 Tax=Streptomyces sp. NPDC059909 TaxID=3346998 RepID=UPI003659A07F